MAQDGTSEVRSGTLLLVGMGDVIRQRRLNLGLSQAELASRLGVDVRQVRRYEANTTEPTLQGARLLADLLGLSLDELAGTTADYSGSWWSAWQAGGSTIDPGELLLIRRGSSYEVNPSPSSALEPARGVWRGELRTAQEDLLGWFVRDSAPRRGTVVLQPFGSFLRGSWLSPEFPPKLHTGLIVLARDPASAQAHLGELAAEHRTRFDRS